MDLQIDITGDADKTHRVWIGCDLLLGGLTAPQALEARRAALAAARDALGMLAACLVMAPSRRTA